jgi:hypothetical protein
VAGSYEHSNEPLVPQKKGILKGESVHRVSYLSTTNPTCLPGREPRPLRWEASDQPLELQHTHLTDLTIMNAWTTHESCQGNIHKKFRAIQKELYPSGL